MKTRSHFNSVNIFAYQDYRKFLADYFVARKAASPSFSHRLFARSTGLASPSHLLMVISRKRNLSLKSISKIASGMKLGSKEKRYFELLVKFDQTGELEARSQVYSEMLAMKAHGHVLHSLEKERFDFLTSPDAVAIYVLIELKDFSADPSWIAQRLGGRITPANVRDTLAQLERIGLIEKDSKRGFRQCQGALTVADDTRSMAVFKYHQSMLKLAEAALSKPKEVREINGATVSLPLASLPELKERIRAFRKEINRWTSTLEGADEVYQLNVQLFPLTVPMMKSEKS